MSAHLAESPRSDMLIAIRKVIQFLVNLSRSGLAGFLALVLSISASGSWVNWNNVFPLFAVLICLAIGSHIIERLCRRTPDTRPGLWAGLAYTFGAAVGIAVFVADRSFGSFGHFTGV